MKDTEKRMNNEKGILPIRTGKYQLEPVRTKGSYNLSKGVVLSVCDRHLSNVGCPLWAHQK